MTESAWQQHSQPSARTPPVHALSVMLIMVFTSTSTMMEQTSLRLKTTMAGRQPLILQEAGVMTGHQAPGHRNLSPSRNNRMAVSNWRLNIPTAGQISLGSTAPIAMSTGMFTPSAAQVNLIGPTPLGAASPNTKLISIKTSTVMAELAWQQH